jgi:transcriptional regulator with XRE-family HTH domain
MEMTINSQFVRELRAKANWSQEDLAAASGLSIRTIQRVEKHGTASLETRKALASTFGVQPEELDNGNAGFDPYEVRVGTGMLICWLGIAWFLDLGLGIGLLGLGIVYFAGQLFRVAVVRQAVLWEMIVLGALCLLAGSAYLMGLEVRVGAVALIGIGCLMIFSRRTNRLPYDLIKSPRLARLRRDP